MNTKPFFALLASFVLVPVAGCGSETANPINTGGSSSSSSSSSSSGASPGSGGSGGSGRGAPCEPACGAGEVCVESSCHALVVVDTTTGVNADGCRITGDAENTYWMTQDLRRVPNAGGPAAVLDSGIGARGGLVVGDTYVYWTNLGIVRADKNAPPVPGTTAGSPFADEGGNPTQLVSDPDTVALYYLDGSTIDFVFTSGTPDPQAPPTPFSETWSLGTGAPIAEDGAGGIYFWSEASSVLTMLDQDGKSTTLASKGSGVVTDSCDLVAVNGSVYYATAPTPGAGGTVATRDITTGKEPVTIVDSSVGATGVFTIDNAFDLYFMTSSQVMKTSQTGAGPTVSLASLDLPTPFPSCMFSDGKYVFWVDGLNLMRYTQ